MRDRTWIGESGKRYPGTEMIGTLLDVSRAAVGPNRDEARAATLREIAHWCDQRQDGAEILEGFHALDSENQPASA
jgi:hypothetical protein